MAATYLRQNSATGNSTNPSVSIDMTDADVIIVGVQVNNTPTVSNPLVGASALTLIAQVHDMYVYRFANTAPLTGSQTVQVTRNTAGDWVIGVVAISDADTTTPIADFDPVTNTELTSISGTVDTDTNALIVDVCHMINDSMAANGAQTERVSRDSWNGGFVSFGMSTKPGAASVTTTWTASGTFGDNSLVVVAVNGASGPDTTPDSFSFTDQTDVALSTVITSAPITVSGIDAAATISVSGGTYSINSTTVFTSSSGTVNNGDLVRARHTSSGANSTATNTIVTIGGVSDTFTSTTLAQTGIAKYRIYGQLSWLSCSGNAIFSIVNKVNSGKKVSITSVEIFNSTSMTAAHGSQRHSTYNLVRCSQLGDNKLFTLAAQDTNASSLQSQSIYVVGDSSYTESANSTIGKVGIVKQFSPGSTGSWLASARFGGRINSQSFSNVYNGKTLNANKEKLIVRPGEKIALVPNVFNNSIPLFIEICICVHGTPMRSYTGNFFVNATSASSCLIGLDNRSGSAVAEIMSISVREVGYTDAVYFQLVPVGTAVIGSDSNHTITPIKHDTSMPDLTTGHVGVYADIPILPYGQFENPINDSSPLTTGKLFNYLKVKDFTGPVYFSQQSDLSQIRTSALPDSFGITSHKLNAYGGGLGLNKGFRRTPIVLREDEGVALVVTAVTSNVASNVPVGLPGCTNFDFGVNFTVEPEETVSTGATTLTITGLQSGTEVRIFTAGTTTELTGSENVTTGTFSWEFDSNVVSSVDIVIHHLQYQYIKFEDVDLSIGSVLIPALQQPDPQYSNV